MIEIALQPGRLHIRYADDDEIVSIDDGEYLLIREVLADGGYTELDDGTWILLSVN